MSFRGYCSPKQRLRNEYKQRKKEKKQQRREEKMLKNFFNPPMIPVNHKNPRFPLGKLNAPEANTNRLREVGMSQAQFAYCTMIALNLFPGEEAMSELAKHPGYKEGRLEEGIWALASFSDFSFCLWVPCWNYDAKYGWAYTDKCLERPWVELRGVEEALRNYASLMKK